MNERLKELYLQAHSIRNYDGDPMRDGNPPDIYWHGETSAERFAELIVRECVRYFNEDYQRDFDVKWREDLSKGIKQHFGVEW
jgi:hypothetical protein